nr:proline-rich receptor-like protein kinase PERK2 [Lolium perenne]
MIPNKIPRLPLPSLLSPLSCPASPPRSPSPPANPPPPSSAALLAAAPPPAALLPATVSCPPPRGPRATTPRATPPQTLTLAPPCHGSRAISCGDSARRSRLVAGILPAYLWRRL